MNTILKCKSMLNMMFFIFRDEELDHNVELTAALVNSGVDLKFFPEAPAEKDAVNRVSYMYFVIYANEAVFSVPLG